MGTSSSSCSNAGNTRNSNNIDPHNDTILNEKDKEPEDINAGNSDPPDDIQTDKDKEPKTNDDVVVCPIISNCANCSKGEENSGDLKICAACKMVKYCNRECQLKHHPQHKQECKKRAAELHDVKLFKQPPDRDECPICFLPPPPVPGGMRNSVCCGQSICGGCVYQFLTASGLKALCAYCRSPLGKSLEEMAEYRKKRMEADDPSGFYNEAMCYQHGTLGYSRDLTKAFELYLRAAELGKVSAVKSVAYAYLNGDGVGRNLKKSKHYMELAAMGGDTEARRYLGDSEMKKGNFERATRHYLIAASFGDNDSVYQIEDYVKKGYVTKDNYEEAYELHQTYVESIRSDQRDEAAAKMSEFAYYVPLQSSADDDEELFKQPPPNEDCPICLIPLPLFSDSPLSRRYQSCCGQTICGGCMWPVSSPRMASGAPVPCPSCKTLNSEDEKEIVKGLIKRAEIKDVDAMALLGTKYIEGSIVPQSTHKAIEIWEEAAELGGIRACYTLGEIYKPGSAKGVDDTGIDKDWKKAFRYHARAAKGGHDLARYALGVLENYHGSKIKAMKHFLIGTASGNDEALTIVKQGFADGRVTKEEFADALRAYEESKKLMNNAQRDKPKETERRMMNMMKIMTGGRGPSTVGGVLEEGRKIEQARKKGNRRR